MNDHDAQEAINAAISAAVLVGEHNMTDAVRGIRAAAIDSAPTWEDRFDGLVGFALASAHLTWQIAEHCAELAGDETTPQHVLQRLALDAAMHFAEDT